MSNEDVSAGLAVYGNIIKRLLSGWIPNHKSGVLVHQWWHPHKPNNYIDPMSEAEFLILDELEHELDTETIKGLKINE